MVYDPAQAGHYASTPLSRLDGHGQCSAWADLLYVTLRAQGASASKQWIRADTTTYRRFCVTDGDVQGGVHLSRPDTQFGFHVLVRATVFPDRLYDPSMGQATDKGTEPTVEDQWELNWVIDFQKLDYTWLGTNPPLNSTNPPSRQLDWAWAGY